MQGACWNVPQRRCAPIYLEHEWVPYWLTMALGFAIGPNLTAEALIAENEYCVDFCDRKPHTARA